MKKQIQFGVIITFVFCITYIALYHSTKLFHFIPFTNFFETTSFSLDPENYVLLTEGCKVPRYDPFDSTVLKYYKKTTGEVECNGKRYLNVINNKVIIDNDEVQKDFDGENFTCTYTPILRNPKNLTSRADNKFEYGKKGLLKFGVDSPSEFIKVYCGTQGNETYEEFLASTPIKPDVEKRCQERSAYILNKNLLNVIVVGIDSISKINFERHFKLTAEYLRKNLSVFEFEGYMKVADNTFPNLTPVLTGHFIEHYYNSSNSRRYFDDLDFIWKNFSSIGYRTLLAEDAPDMATYNYVKNGFQFQPTDYFFRPFTIAIEDSPWQMASKAHCFQAKPEIRVLFDYLWSFLVTMAERPYFAFTWAARLTHGDVNKAGYADKPAFELLRDINDMGLLNKSMLVFMSDHGIRFGGIRKTFIGKVEERMPFMFIYFPKWFLEAHPGVARNLRINQGRLTTPFDLHETLVDVYQMMSGNTNYVRTPYGISLFKEIAPERNCQSAYILPHWCVCQEYQKLSPDDTMVVQAAQKVLQNINARTELYRNECAMLTLSKIVDARISKATSEMLRYEDLENRGDENSVIFGNETDSYSDLQIMFEAYPGDGEFESTVRQFKDRIEVSGISRINMYGNQGDCINDFDLRKYCYCD